MANNPTQPNVGFIPSNPEEDRQTPIHPPPPPPTYAPRFPPPILHLQKDQGSVHSNAISPANGSPVPHMSTPPGPPVFTSPVRPAAVPFRTSPASPQPPALSTASSLPTSSSPLYSNGSFDLQSQVSGGIEDHIPLGESSSFVLFSAHKVSSALLSFELVYLSLSYIESLFSAYFHKISTIAYSLYENKLTLFYLLLWK
jgi:hypothetical protein